MRYFIHLGFEGSNYSGWQKQNNTSNTIQEVIESALLKIFKTPITVYGCGRTDAGVHASQYILHIDIENAFDFDLKFRLNKNLPSDIAVFDVKYPLEDYHCRYDASSRTYDYFIHWTKDPSLIRYSTLWEDSLLDFKKMQKAVRLLEETKDFKALCKRPDQYNHTICNVMEAKLFIDQDNGRMRFTITANRFLRGMVRLCIFYLLKIGSHEISLDEFERVLNFENKTFQNQPAPPNGLFLTKVSYPFIDFKSSHFLIDKLKEGLH